MRLAPRKTACDTPTWWPSGWYCKQNTSCKYFEIIESSWIFLNLVQIFRVPKKIPIPLQYDMLKHLHTRHFGIEKTRHPSRESVYWPNISKEIDHLIQPCDTCQPSKRQHESEPLLSHEIPSTPWTKLGTDLLQTGNDNYLLITDYHFKIPSSLQASKHFKFRSGKTHVWNIQPIWSPQGNHLQLWTPVRYQTAIQGKVWKMGNHTKDFFTNQMV